MSSAMDRFLPLQWAKDWRADDLRPDLVAGLTTAVMLIPQAMAYALLANLPPIVGLYAAIFPLIAYALFASSRDLAVGPVAMDSLLVAAALAPLAQGQTPEYVALAALLALMAGAMQWVMGAAKLGFVVNLLSHPVISGFSSAAALIIAASQLKHLLGIKLVQNSELHRIVLEALGRLDELHLLTLGIGLGAMAVLHLLKKRWPKAPGALVVVVLGTVLVGTLGLDQQGVSIVGAVPGGFPSPGLPSLDLQAAQKLLPMALTIALIAFLESISVAKAVAARKRYEVDPNKELIALGMANMTAGLFRGYPVAGGFSRTAVNANAGARSPVASIITAVVVALTLLFFTPALYYLPNAVLAAIIMTAVFGLVDVAEMRRLWRVNPPELGLMALTFAATLGIGIGQGIAVGAVASMLMVFWETTRPHVAVLGRVPGTQAYRNTANYPEAQTFAGLLIVRMDAQFYFGNVPFLRETLRRLQAQAQSPVKTIVLDASSMNRLDSTAARYLGELVSGCREQGLRLMLANVKGPVMRVMKRAGVLEILGEDALYLTVHCAVERAMAEGLVGKGPEEVPMREVRTSTLVHEDAPLDSPRLLAGLGRSS